MVGEAYCIGMMFDVCGPWCLFCFVFWSEIKHLEGTFVHTCTFGAPPFVEQISNEQQDLEESDIFVLRSSLSF